MTARDPAAAGRAVTLDVSLLGRAYKFACKESERAELQDAAAFLDGQMREIRAAGKVAAIDRIAVMAALNIAHELLRARAGSSAVVAVDTAAAAPPPAGLAMDAPAVQRRIATMKTAIEQLLAESEIAS